ncbi:MAG: hypothetical protein J5735_05570 [Prevotella sp.]|nr:hypothetical protein [Prevotella sp.]
MKIRLKRMYYKDTYTIGALQVQSEDNPNVMVYFCDTLEPRWRDLTKEKKVAGKTAIPSGTYKIELRYSKKFEKMMPYLCDVPFFEGIMIHIGNVPSDTRGCILVGKAVRPRKPEEENPTGEATVIGRLTDSRITFNRLYELIREAVRKGEEVEVKVA